MLPAHVRCAMKRHEGDLAKAAITNMTSLAIACCCSANASRNHPTEQVKAQALNEQLHCSAAGSGGSTHAATLFCRIWMLRTDEIGNRHIGHVRVRLSSSLAHSSHMQKWRQGSTVVFLRLVRQTTQCAEKSSSPPPCALLASVIP